MAPLDIPWKQLPVQSQWTTSGDKTHGCTGTTWVRSRNMNSAEVKSVYKALQEDTAFAAYGDTSRSYGFVTDHCVSCGWKPLRISAPFGSFDSITGAAYVILQGSFFRTDDRGIMWQRDFILTLNSATCDASCGGSFMETIHFKDAPMVFGSQPQTTATLPCIKPQQDPLRTAERTAPRTDAAAAAGHSTRLPPPVVFTPCKPFQPGQPGPAPIKMCALRAPADADSTPEKPAPIAVTPCRPPRQEPKEPTVLAAIVESQVDKEEEAMRAATGSPAAAAAAPAPEEAPAQRSQPGAGSDIDSKGSLVNRLDQTTEGPSSDASSDGTWTVVARRRRSPTSVLRGSQRAGQVATQPDNGRKERVRPTQRTTRAQRRRQSQPQPQPQLKPTPEPAPEPAPKPTPAPAPKPAPTQPAVAAKLQASYKETLLSAATGSPAAAVPEPRELPPQQSRPSASNKVADESTGADLPHQQAQELKEHTAAVEPRVSRREDALRAAMGSPVAVVPTLEEEQPEQCQPSAGSDATAKCSLPLAVEALPDKKAQGPEEPAATIQPQLSKKKDAPLHAATKGSVAAVPASAQPAPTATSRCKAPRKKAKQPAGAARPQVSCKETGLRNAAGRPVLAVVLEPAPIKKTEKPKEPAASAKPRLSYKDAAATMRAATGRPLAAVPAAVEAFPRLGQRNIGSQSADQQAEEPKQPVAASKPQVTYWEAMMRTAVGSPAPKDARPQQSRPSAGSSSSDKGSQLNLMGQDTEGPSSDASSDGTWTVVARRRRSPTSVLRGSQRAGQEATQPDSGRKEGVRPDQRTSRAQRRRQSQPQPKPTPVPLPTQPAVIAAKLLASNTEKEKHPAAVAKPQAKYKEALLRAATGSPAAAVPAPRKAPQQQRQPGAGSKAADTCSCPGLMGLQTENKEPAATGKLQRSYQAAVVGGGCACGGTASSQPAEPWQQQRWQLKRRQQRR